MPGPRGDLARADFFWASKAVRLGAG
jgi:hypothetical protein